MHAVTCAIAENRVALGDKFIAAATLAALMSEGQSGDDAIHGIGSVLPEYI